MCCDRYSAVCRPHAYRDSNITERTGTRVAKYVTPVIIFSAIYNIPKFLEYKVSGNVRKCSIYHSDKTLDSKISTLFPLPPVVLKQTTNNFSNHWFSGQCFGYGEIISVSQSVTQHRQHSKMMFPPFPLIIHDKTCFGHILPPAFVQYLIRCQYNTKLPCYVSWWIVVNSYTQA